MKIINIFILLIIYTLISASSCEPQDPDVSSTRTLKLHLTSSPGNGCELSFGVGATLEVNVFDLNHNLISSNYFTTNDFSSSGEVNLEVPISGDFALSLPFEGGCNSCCQCAGNPYGRPKFVGAQDQAMHTDTKLGVKLTFIRCNCNCIF